MNDMLLFSISAELQTFALRVALSAVAVGVGVLVLAWVLRRRSDPMRYGILFGGIVGLLAAPLLVALGTFIPLPSRETEDNVEVVRIPAEILPAFLDQPQLPVEPEPEASISAIPLIGSGLIFLWIAGTCLALGRLLLGLHRHCRTVPCLPWEAAFWTEECKHRLAKKVGLTSFPEVMRSPAAPMPLVLGIWRPCIVLPEQAPPSWGETQWEAVLLHEAAHIARRDHWAALTQAVAASLFWWCLPVHAINRKLNHLRENICDDYALEGTCDQVAYAEMLVESAERLLDLRAVPAPLALLDSAHGGLEVRLNRLLEKERRPMLALSLTGRIVAGGFLGLACLLTTAATAFSQGETAKPKKIEIKIVVDGKEIDLNAGDLQALIEAAQPKEGPRVKIKKFEGQPDDVLLFTPGIPPMPAAGWNVAHLLVPRSALRIASPEPGLIASACLTSSSMRGSGFAFSVFAWG